MSDENMSDDEVHGISRDEVSLVSSATPLFLPAELDDLFPDGTPVEYIKIKSDALAFGKCIYFLYLHKKIVYIGTASKCATYRIMTHCFHGKRFDSAYCFDVPAGRSAHRMERQLIYKFKPYYNDAGRYMRLVKNKYFLDLFQHHDIAPTKEEIDARTMACNVRYEMNKDTGFLMPRRVGDGKANKTQPS